MTVRDPYDPLLPPTTKIPETEIIKGLLHSLERQVGELPTREDFHELTHDLHELSQRLGEVEDQVRSLQRAPSSVTSERVRAVASETESQADLALDKKISDLHVGFSRQLDERDQRLAARQDAQDVVLGSVLKQVSTLASSIGSIDKIAKKVSRSPLARDAVKILLTAALSWAAVRGLPVPQATRQNSTLSPP